MKIFFSVMLVSMLAVTTWASVEQNVLVGFQEMIRTRWGIATLFDTYFGFFTVYVYIAYRERTWLRRLWWFVLICLFGTIAISIYFLMQIAAQRPLLKEPIS